jgi:formylglycine-generating enzyme required for sulfatase activity
MPRLQALLECVGRPLCDKGRKALLGQWSFPEALPEVARAALELAHRKLPGADLRAALADCAACDGREFDRRVGEAIADLSQSCPVPKPELTAYLSAFPAAVRQALRRPSDPTGHTAPDGLSFYKPEELAAFLPPRVPRLRPGATPPNLDGWTLTRLLGMGPWTEVWEAEDPGQPEHSPAALKFVTDPDAARRVRDGAGLFTKAFELNGVPGVLPLRSVYLEADPPCLESPLVPGYDLAGLMLDWRGRYDGPKPEAALKLVRRLAAIVAEAHARGFVHADLKPANVLLRPTEGGKFTLWVADWGWGRLAAARALADRGAPRGELARLAARGAATALYASPQLAKEPAAPTDDVHALGVIWYQLLRRDPAAPAPVGTEWAEEMRPAGVTDSQARILQACLSTRPDRRPKSAGELAEHLAAATVAPADGTDGSRLIPLRNPGSAVYASTPPPPSTARGRVYDAAAASASAAALLANLGGGPITSSPAATSAVGGVRLVKNAAGMTFVRVPAGSFRMGAADDEPGRRDHEGPAHEVKISKPFYLSVTPVTQAQYEAVRHKNPSAFTRPRGGGPDHPVESVTWDQAVRFCEKLAKLPDEEALRRVYRLPTEAEWEYACRAGTLTAFNTGAALGPKDAVFAGAGGKHGGKGTAPAGQLAANAWGLQDMHGNVQEWVADWFDEYYYCDSPGENPPGPKKGTQRVVRGGCWAGPAADCRSAARRGHTPDAPSDTIGFRVLLVAG